MNTDQTQQQHLSPGLYLVPTPIGNLRDITLRAMDVLSAADAVLCEDSRVTGALLQHYGLKKQLIVYNDHSDDNTRDYILGRLEQGGRLALVSDAGTPLLSDPGYKLVRAAREKAVSVIALPGANALLPALQLSALPCESFLFAGFLPHKSAARRKMLDTYKNVGATLVFYETPHRIVEAVADAFAVLGDRKCALARELTKMFEECRIGTLAGWAADDSLIGTLKGEMVLVIEGAPEQQNWDEAAIDAALADLLPSHGASRAADEIARLSGWKKRDVYQRALAKGQGR